MKSLKEIRKTLEVKSESKKEDILDLKRMIKNPDPSRVKEYGGKNNYVKMLKDKLAKLEAINSDLEEKGKCKGKKGDKKILKMNNEEVEAEIIDIVKTSSGTKVLFKTGEEKHTLTVEQFNSKVLNEAPKSGDKEAYQKFFKSVLKKFGVESPEELDNKKKKEFFDYIDKNWKADDEKNESTIQTSTEESELNESSMPAKIQKMIQHILKSKLNTETKREVINALERKYRIKEETDLNEGKYGPKNPKKIGTVKDNHGSTIDVELDDNKIVWLRRGKYLIPSGWNLKTLKKSNNKNLSIDFGQKWYVKDIDTVLNTVKEETELKEELTSVDNKKANAINRAWERTQGDKAKQAKIIKKHGLKVIISSVRPGAVKLGIINQLASSPTKIFAGLDDDDNLIFVTGKPPKIYTAGNATTKKLFKEEDHPVDTFNL